MPTLDDRAPVESCMYGCHSELDELRGSVIESCDIAGTEAEKPCEGCTRINKKGRDE